MEQKKWMGDVAAEYTPWEISKTFIEWKDLGKIMGGGVQKSIHSV